MVESFKELNANVFLFFCIGGIDDKLEVICLESIRSWVEETKVDSEEISRQVKEG